jgi:hypothetical protein
VYIIEPIYCLKEARILLGPQKSMNLSGSSMKNTVQIGRHWQKPWENIGFM